MRKDTPKSASRPGRHDGLYWAPARDGATGPLGANFTLAAADAALGAGARPYHGYFFRVLAADVATGFAILAYPARHGVTGTRSFGVSEDGIVYSRDLGPRTQARVQAMNAFDPRRGWQREDRAPPAHEAGGMPALASARGCTLCHVPAQSPRDPDAALPLAPSWREIQARYRERGDAEERLTRILVAGADPAERHWQDRLDFNRMEANPKLTPDEARALVRWILSAP